MGKGGYLGGSTVIRGYTPNRPKAKRKGLLALEVEFRKTGKVSPQTLAPPKSANKKRKPKSRNADAGLKAPDARTGHKFHTGVDARGTISRAGTGRMAARARPEAPPPTHSPRYSKVEVGEHLRRHYPNCTAHKRVATLASMSNWTGMGLAEVVASCMESYLLYEVCGLQRLVELGIPRDRAVELVTPQVKAVLGMWGAKTVWLK